MGAGLTEGVNQLLVQPSDSDSSMMFAKLFRELDALPPCMMEPDHKEEIKNWCGRRKVEFSRQFESRRTEATFGVWQHVVKMLEV